MLVATGRTIEWCKQSDAREKAMGNTRPYLKEIMPATEPGFRYNPVQIEYAGSIEQALASPKGSFHFLEADTGIGKSLAYLLSLADWWAQVPRERKVVIATHSRALQQQLSWDQNRRILAGYMEWAGLPLVDVRVRMGRANYVSHRRLAMVLGVQRLEDAVEQKDRPKAERDLARWALSTQGCLLEMEGIELPEGVSLQDICLTENEPLPKNLESHFERAEAAGIVIINTALLANDLVRRDGVITGAEGKETVLVIDEAEHFPDVAANLFAKHVSFRSTQNLARKLGYKRNAEHWSKAQAKFTNKRRAGEVQGLDGDMTGDLKQALGAIVRTKIKSHPETPEEAEWEQLRVTANAMLRRIKKGDQKMVLSYSRVNGLPSLVRQNEAAGMCLRNGAHARVTILTSATLSDMMDNGLAPTFKYIRGRVGIQGEAFAGGLERRHSARRFGQLSFIVPREKLPRVLEEGEKGFQLREAFARAAVKEILDGAEGRTLVLCASYSDVEALHRAWPDRELGRWVSHRRGAAVNQIAMGLSGDAVLVTPAGWEGLSPERKSEPFWSRVVLLRNPTPAINKVEQYMIEQYCREKRGMDGSEAKRRAEAVLHARLNTQTLHKIRQGIGRALRHPQDRCEILFLDPRFPTPKHLKDNGGMHLGLAAAIPARFLADYMGAMAESSNEETVVI